MYLIKSPPQIGTHQAVDRKIGKVKKHPALNKHQPLTPPPPKKKKEKRKKRKK